MTFFYSSISLFVSLAPGVLLYSCRLGDSFVGIEGNFDEVENKSAGIVRWTSAVSSRALRYWSVCELPTN